MQKEQFKKEEQEELKDLLVFKQVQLLLLSQLLVEILKEVVFLVNNQLQEEDSSGKRVEDFSEELKQQPHLQSHRLVVEDQHLVKDKHKEVVDFLEVQKQYLHLELVVLEDNKHKLLQLEEVYLVQSQQQEEDFSVNQQQMLVLEAEEVYSDQQLLPKQHQQEDYLEQELNSLQLVEVYLEQNLQVHHCLGHHNQRNLQLEEDYLELSNHQQEEDFLEDNLLKQQVLEQNQQEQVSLEHLLNLQEDFLEAHQLNKHQEVSLEVKLINLQLQHQDYLAFNSLKLNKFQSNNTSAN